MKLTVYKERSQTEIDKVYEVDNYDLMYGTVEDILAILDEIDDLNDDSNLLRLVQKHRSKVNDLLFDIFPDLTDEELKRTKVKELVPVFIDLFSFVREGFGETKN